MSDSFLELNRKIEFLMEENREKQERILFLENGRPVDWSNAPFWARYRTQDSNGLCEFWEEEPVMKELAWGLGVKHTKYAYDYDAYPGWRYSLDKRPRAKTLLEVFADEIANAKSLDDLRVWLDKAMKEGME